MSLYIYNLNLCFEPNFGFNLLITIAPDFRINKFIV